jgi:nitrate/nitrite-specific signal transduction histidine kinase
MKKSLRFQAVLIFLLHLLLLFSLVWTAFVPLEQMLQCAGDIGIKTSCQQNLLLVQYMMWTAIVFAASMGLFIPWMIFHKIITPLISIRKFIHQSDRGDMKSPVKTHAGIEFDALAAEINRMMFHQQQEQARLQELNYTLSAISACRRLMIHETDEKKRIQECCNILVNTGKYRMAWIGYTEDDAHTTLTPEAQAGYQNGGLHSESWMETAWSPTTRAIRNKRVAIIGNVFNDPLFAPLQADASRHGYSSIIAIPISTDRRIIGALTLYAEKPDAFGAEIVHLLMELAEDLFSGIHATRTSGIHERL